MKIATKPLRPKNIYYRFSISRFLKEYDYPEFLIIGQNEFKKRVNLESVTLNLFQRGQSLMEANVVQ